jgi:hypothetical protein
MWSVGIEPSELTGPNRVNPPAAVSSLRDDLMNPFSITDPYLDPEQELTDYAWRTYGPAALRFATVLVGPDDAHDIATSAFLRVTNSTGWVGLHQPQSYLFRAVSSEAHNHQRQRSRWRRER